MSQKICIIDADLTNKKRHRFPNLAAMKISSFHKQRGNEVVLKLDIRNLMSKLNYNNIFSYDKVYVTKVFTDTIFPENVLQLKHVEYGGTGFFYDKSPQLPDEIEHIMPDYHLYDDFVASQDEIDHDRRDTFEIYQNVNIGKLTTGCFRGCEFCVNRNCKIVKLHSPHLEFYNPDNKYSCFLDDNFLGYGKSLSLLEELLDFGQQVQFKQGLDIRLLSEKNVQLLAKLKYKGDYIFAFDNIKDKEEIVKKLTLWRKHTKASTKMYVLCAFDRNNKYDMNFWRRDILETLERMKVLMQFQCIPYFMRYEKYKECPFGYFYTLLTKWCMNPGCYKKSSIREYFDKWRHNKILFEVLQEVDINHYIDLKYEDFKIKE
jgi:hypothetical protein